MKKSNAIYPALAAAAVMLAACTKAPASPNAADPAASIPPGDSEHLVTVEGTERTYLLHIPKGVQEGEPLPLIVVYHGQFWDANFTMQTTGFNDIADADGFLVAYPNGTGTNPANLSFNAGLCCGNAAEQNVDEQAFLREILSDAGNVARIDPQRVYLAGWDIGAFLAFRLACEMSGTLAGIATVNGALEYSPCLPEQPVSIIHFHGTNDRLMPYEGGIRMFGTADLILPPARDVVGAWAGRNGCSLEVEERQEGLITSLFYTGCLAGIAVEIHILEGQPHSWPSQYVVPVSRMIWDFFAAHPKS